MLSAHPFTTNWQSVKGYVNPEKNWHEPQALNPWTHPGARGVIPLHLLPILSTSTSLTPISSVYFCLKSSISKTISPIFQEQTRNSCLKNCSRTDWKFYFKNRLKVLLQEQTGNFFFPEQAGNFKRRLEVKFQEQFWSFYFKNWLEIWFQVHTFKNRLEVFFQEQSGRFEFKNDLGFDFKGWLEVLYK